ncbi:thioredoxin domain-containing protein [Sandarakinorhabdus sp. AAP62]|uniref:thioredoxin domain-containing protein n=1 Tax=Sandarakinorhabdus sp. AAP62 TaxID=1248916 RepID=UPI00036A1B5A|nr:thioredoxin domain-containing protein [Sandarakinorhabdus sp. AAP62]
MMRQFLTVSALAFALAACGDKTAAPAGETASAPAVAAPAGQNWVDVVAATPEGGFRMGNPDARVKLVEFASLTCPHCREFHEAASATLKSKYIASGNVSYEFRNFVLNGPDFAATVLARCQGAGPFFGLLDNFFADQAGWTEPFGRIGKADQEALGKMPEEQAIARMAELGGLADYVKLRGIPRAKFDQCLADPAQMKAINDLRNQAVNELKLTGTPSFIINGTVQEGVYTWADLEPKLQTALR